MNHMQIFFPVGICVFAVGSGAFWAGRKRRGVERTFHVLAFFSNASNIAVHLFVWYDLCIIWCTYEWENKNPCDRRLWIPHTVLMHAHIHTKWANVFLVGGVKNEFYGSFFRYAVRRYVHVWCAAFRNYSVHKNRAFVRVNTHTHTRSDRERKKERQKHTFVVEWLDRDLHGYNMYVWHLMYFNISLNPIESKITWPLRFYAVFEPILNDFRHNLIQFEVEDGYTGICIEHRHTQAHCVPHYINIALVLCVQLHVKCTDKSVNCHAISRIHHKQHITGPDIDRVGDW